MLDLYIPYEVNKHSMCFIFIVKNVVIRECILCIANGKPMFIRVVNECDVSVFQWVTFLVFNHETAIETRSGVVRRDTENPIRNCYRFRIENGRVTTQSEITQELSLCGAHDICTSRCEVNG